MFDQINIGDLSLKNQILAPPLKQYQANTDGTVNAMMAKYYRNLATQGMGTLIVESAYVAKQGRSRVTQLGISDEEHLEGLTKLVAGVKSEGVKVGVRLAHAGAKTSEEISGEQPIGPSILNFGKDYDTSREFDAGDCEEIVLFFVHAAERAEEIGADFIEINGAQQLLLDQCLSLRHNNRDDEYGTQTMSGRLKLSIEVIEAIRKRVSPDMPISYFFSIHDKLEDGFTADDLESMISMLEDAGIDYFHPTTIHVMNKFFDKDETFIEWVAKFTDKALVAEGNIKSPQVLKEISALEKAQFYALDRTLFSRPQWYQFLQKKLITA